jgi:hypothetical protein
MVRSFRVVLPHSPALALTFAGYPSYWAPPLKSLLLALFRSAVLD